MKFGNTNREVISTIKHSIADLGPINEENSFSNRELYFLLLRYRSVILAQKLKDKSKTVSRHNYQTIECIPVDDVDSAECPCETIGDKVFKKTRVSIPKSIGNYTSVISVGNHITYNYIAWDAIQDLQHTRFSAEKNKPYYTMKTSKDGTYLYLYNDKHGDSVTVTGIFENPLEVQNFPSCETGKTDPCFSPLDQEFIIDPEYLPIIYDMLLQTKFKFRPQIADQYNNNIDDAQQMRPPIK